MTSSSITPIVEMNNIHKSFFHVHVLKGVSFNLYPGEVHALMGENGAGKSTLIKILTGIYRKDEGSVIYKGKEVEFKNPKEAERAGISIIHQELNNIPYLSIAENFFLGKEETIKRTPLIKSKQMIEKTEEALKNLGIHLDPKRLMMDCSVGEQQMVEIARAVTQKSEVIIMDEPTAALTDREIESLFSVIEDLKRRGVAIVYISHRMEEIFRICDRITVLRDGQSIDTKNIQETNFEEIVKLMVGRELGERFPKRTTTPGEIRLKVQNLDVGDHIKGIQFDVRKGEILGVAGLMGAGRTEIMEGLFGAKKGAKGVLYLDGKQIPIKNPETSIKHGIAFVTEDRKGEGLVLDLSVRENLTLPNFKKVSSIGFMKKKKEEKFTDEMIEKLRIKTSGREQVVKSLSGGNQQKVVVGKWLGIEPKVLILDEPTRGVDVGAKKEIYDIMNELTEQGVSIIMISSELPEILGMSDRIMVIHEGKITAILNRKEATQENIMVAATGG
ncbi:sugar ABC transporter ATP-binding protein [Fervidibacillus halotolerans]|uniref:Sugar ABC transporter ATP-binding protein n=1 Tax=Fervidibacillus halotolerans TaxID=2980027 RepID=A0A9E8S0F5_9BACI|nr:sugar ABC transporter ATP-binding protein [Fervidibacillus halotolerans]WAA12542.1 sugar ABC transporter ATP-binding protein [Fervidibacillus halotolerans]